MDLVEKTLHSQEIFAGRIVRLRVDTVELPNGQQSTREVVEHAGAVAIVALDSADQVVLVRQYRHPVDRILAEIPAGTLENGEDPLDCARRELQEETGLIAANWKKILTYYSTPGFTNECLHIFMATGLTEGIAQPDQDEFVEPVRVPLSEAYQQIFTGQIADGKSIIGIQYAYSQR
ncbi:MAG TPA: NUDIX hydrolase [Syntrophomonadaceae bacterium]|jgi:ADP-ribose pyrophosphatase|nr:NUDIX hydrolase [Syntrophomonadaceae bacterium]